MNGTGRGSAWCRQVVHRWRSEAVDLSLPAPTSASTSRYTPSLTALPMAWCSARAFARGAAGGLVQPPLCPGHAVHRSRATRVYAARCATRRLRLIWPRQASACKSSARRSTVPRSAGRLKPKRSRGSPRRSCTRGTVPWRVSDRGAACRRAGRQVERHLCPDSQSDQPAAVGARFSTTGVPYRMESGWLVLQTQEVRDLLSCLRAIDDPSDQGGAGGGLVRRPTAAPTSSCCTGSTRAGARLRAARTCSQRPCGAGARFVTRLHDDRLNRS